MDLVGFPGFLGGFCFFMVWGFMVSYMIWKASVCQVERTPKHTCLNCIKVQRSNLGLPAQQIADFCYLPKVVQIRETEWGPSFQESRLEHLSSDLSSDGWRRLM